LLQEQGFNFGPLIRATTEFSRHVRGYVQCHGVGSAGSFGVEGDWDGIAELWFDDVESMQRAFAEPRYLEGSWDAMRHYVTANREKRKRMARRFYPSSSSTWTDPDWYRLKMHRAAEVIGVLGFLLACVTAYFQFRQVPSVHIQRVEANGEPSERGRIAFDLELVALNDGDFTEVLLGASLWQKLQGKFQHLGSDWATTSGLPVPIEPGKMITFQMSGELPSQPSPTLLPTWIVIDALGSETEPPEWAQLNNFPPGRHLFVSGGNWEIFGGRVLENRPFSLE